MRATNCKISLLLLSLATAVTLVSTSPTPASPIQRQQTPFHLQQDEKPALYFADNCTNADQVTFDGHKVVSVDIRNIQELEKLAAVVEVG